MQTKGWVTCTDGRPTFLSLWDFILRASELLLAGHSQCKPGCLLSETALWDQIMRALRAVEPFPLKSFLLAFSKASPTVIVLWQIFTKELWKSKLTQTFNCEPPVSFFLLRIWRGVQDERRFDEKTVHRWASPELLLGAYCWNLLLGCCGWKKHNDVGRNCG